mmetsp:Transcript_2092/g.3073  ORF Transcript_2092/g.3073 Transcript_2092/m.3073 type:complete len:414 (+) Transcript_2092:106-1347(+)
MINNYIQSDDLTNSHPLENNEDSSQCTQTPGCARTEKVEQYFLRGNDLSSSDRTIPKKNLSQEYDELQEECDDTKTILDQGTVLSSPFQPPAEYVIRKVSKLLPTGYSPRPVRALELLISEKDLFMPCPKKPDLYYDKAIMGMIYAQDIEKFRQFLKQGLPLQIANEYGDTLLHIACRYVHLQVVQFLIEEASLSVWVHDERGQTPLHCLCHSTDPAVWDVVDFLLLYHQEGEVANLFLVQDEQGFMPLDYAPRETWSIWVKYLRRKGLASFTPTRPCFYHMPLSPILLQTNNDTTDVATHQTIVETVVQVNRFLATYALEKRKEAKKRRKSGNASSLTLEIKAKQLKKTLCQAILKKIETNSSISNDEIRSFQQIMTLPLDKLYDEFQTQRDIVRSESHRDLSKTFQEKACM